MSTNELLNHIEAEYYPYIPREEIASKCRFKLNKNELTNLGTSFSVVAAELSKLAFGSSGNEGLYRCVFPNGVTGTLAQAKDGSGYLGSIINGGIVGQARWIPAGTTAITINPATIAIGVALMGFNKKLDDIKEAEKDILHFLESDKESQLKGSVNTLSETMSDYRFNSDNNTWKTAKLAMVSNLKNKAVNSIDFYCKRIKHELDKQSLIHVSQQAKKVTDRVQNNFKCYQLSVYLYAYASFVEVMLGGNYKSDYLDQITKRIEEYSNEYRMDYSKCYDLLNDYTKTAVGPMALKGLGNVSKGAGEAIAKIPIIRKGLMDEALIVVGDSAKKLSRLQTDKALRDFRENRDAGTRIFVDNIDMINEISNKAVELIIDKDTVYICA